MHFPGGPEMAMPPNGTGLAGQQPQPPAPAGAQNPGPASAAAPGATYEAKIEIAHKHAADAASRDAKRACQPGVNVPFADLDDAIARLLPYHVFSAADEDELDLSVVPPIREDDDAEKTSADAPAPARSRAQAWAESRAEFVRAFVRELAFKRRRVEAREEGAAGAATADASRRADSARDPKAEAGTGTGTGTSRGDPDPGPPRGDALSPAEEYLVAAKTLEVAKRRDAAERAARARAQAEQRRQAEAERQKQQARARAEAEARRAAAQAEAQRRAAAAKEQAHAQAQAVSTSGEIPSSTAAAPGGGETEKRTDAASAAAPRSTVVGPAIVVRAPGLDPNAPGFSSGTG